MDNKGPTIVSIIPYRVLPAKLGGEKGIAIFNEYLGIQCSLTAVTTRNNDPALAKGYSLRNILSNHKFRYFNIGLFWTLKKIIKDTGAKHLIIEHPYYAWLAWLLKRTLSVQWIIHSHNIEYMRSKSIGRWWWKALKVYEGWAYRSADKVFFISEDDRAYAQAKWNLNSSKTLAVTYGIEQSRAPVDIERSRDVILARHGIEKGTKLLLFNGALYHSTNFDALSIILEEINPYLLAENDFKYKIIICGKGLPDSFNDLRDYKNKNIVYAGFVDDIEIYFKAAEIFLNPILSGGGVKTKAIEALAMNCTVLSTPLGALGIPAQLCGSKLKVIDSGKWQHFAIETIRSSTQTESIPTAFFDYFYWGNIIGRALSFLINRNA